MFVISYNSPHIRVSFVEMCHKWDAVEKKCTRNFSVLTFYQPKVIMRRLKIFFWQKIINGVCPTSNTSGQVFFFTNIIVVLFQKPKSDQRDNALELKMLRRTQCNVSTKFGKNTSVIGFFFECTRLHLWPYKLRYFERTIHSNPYVKT